MTTMQFTHRELLNLALAMSISARNAYCDERLVTASTEHVLAAKLWDALGSPTNAKRHITLAQAIDNEMIEIAAGNELEEAA